MRRVWRDLKDLEAAKDQGQEPNKESEPENFNDGVRSCVEGRVSRESKDTQAKDVCKVDAYRNKIK